MYVHVCVCVCEGCFEKPCVGNNHVLVAKMVSLGTPLQILVQKHVQSKWIFAWWSNICWCSMPHYLPPQALLFTSLHTYVLSLSPVSLPPTCSCGLPPLRSTSRLRMSRDSRPIVRPDIRPACHVTTIAKTPATSLPFLHPH